MTSYGDGAKIHQFITFTVHLQEIVIFSECTLEIFVSFGVLMKYLGILVSIVELFKCSLRKFC